MLSKHTVAAERLGFTNSDVLSLSPTFLKGVKHFTMRVNYGPLDESVRLSAAARRNIMKLKDEDSHALSAKMNSSSK